MVIFEAILDGGDMSNNKNCYICSKVQNLTKMMYYAGVLITSGSDIPNFSLKAGISLHRELGLLVEAGIPPLKVIKIATRNSASSLGIVNEVGTIEIGKQADLVILKNNPIINISNTRSIEMVIQNGSVVNRSLVGNDLTDYSSP